MPPTPTSPAGRHAAATTRSKLTTFQRTAQRVTDGAGSPVAAAAVVLGWLAWLVAGAFVDFPRWWELVNTCGVPVVTLLMFVVLQHTQNHDARATQLKLDELIRAHDAATNHMMTVEDASAHDLDRIRQDFEAEAQVGDHVA
ncbi:MAG: low affinity iron permease family protein [Acidimicrobiales bacterium]|nr:low affinity iron permease family protein [Acidimicrobiales bacterium]